MIGDWLNDGTPISEVAAFAEKTFGQQNFSGFKGDPRFIQNAYSHGMFSKLRSAIAGLYAWRVSHAAGVTDQERMVRVADFAFRQAWALDPDAPETVYKYANFLADHQRFKDALLLGNTALAISRMKGWDPQLFPELVKYFQDLQRQNPPARHQ